MDLVAEMWTIYLEMSLNAHGHVSIHYVDGGGVQVSKTDNLLFLWTYSNYFFCSSVLFKMFPVKKRKKRGTLEYANLPHALSLTAQ